MLGESNWTPRLIFPPTTGFLLEIDYGSVGGFIERRGLDFQSRSDLIFTT